MSHQSFNQEIVIKALLLGTLIALTLAVVPAWAVSEKPAAESSAAKKHKPVREHKLTRKHKVHKKHGTASKHRTARKHRVARKHRAAKTSPAVKGRQPVPQSAAKLIMTPELAVPRASATVAGASAVQPSAETPGGAASKAGAATAVSPPEAELSLIPYMPPVAVPYPAGVPVAAPPAPGAVPVPPVQARSINPYMPPVAMPYPAGVPVAAPPAPVAVLVPPHQPLPVNPYLQPGPFPPVAAGQPQGILFPAIAKTPLGQSIPATLSFLPNGLGNLPAVPSFADISAQLKNLVPVEVLALLPVDDGATHWPISFKTVYPTGDKPLWVLTLKCPTEAAFGVAPPPVKLVHVILTGAMDTINATGLLPVNLQQVCQ
jgi:hypothetical protein